MTGDALDFALAAMGLTEPRLRERLMNLYLTLAPFPDALDTLRQLQARDMRMAILSQGSPAMLGPVVEAAGMTALFDAVLSIEEVGVFKPHPSTLVFLGSPSDALAPDRSSRLARSASFCGRGRGSPHLAATR